VHRTGQGVISASLLQAPVNARFAGSGWWRASRTASSRAGANLAYMAMTFAESRDRLSGSRHAWRIHAAAAANQTVSRSPVAWLATCWCG